MQAFLLPGHTTKLRLTHWRNDDKVIFRKKEEIFLEQCLFYVDLPWLFYSAFLRTRSASAYSSTLYSSRRKGWFTALYYNVELHTNSLSFLIIWKCLPLKYTPLKLSNLNSVQEASSQKALKLFVYAKLFWIHTK